jgi:hypothetical protein
MFANVKYSSLLRQNINDTTNFFNNCCFSLNEIKVSRKVLIITVELKSFPVSLHFQTVFSFFFSIFQKTFYSGTAVLVSRLYFTTFRRGEALENVEHRCLPDLETLINNVNATKEDPSKDCRTLI